MDFTPKFNRNVFQILLRDLARHENFNTRKLWEEEKRKQNEIRKTSNVINETEINKYTDTHKKKQKKSKQILIEKHIKLKNSKGPDASTSMDTTRLSELVSHVRTIEKANF